MRPKTYVLLFVISFATISVFAQIPSEWKKNTTLIPCRKGDKWGYCNRNKVVVIPTIYDEANPFFEDGTAVVTKGSESYPIDKKGKKYKRPFTVEVAGEVIEGDVIEEVTEEVASPGNNLVENRYSKRYKLQEDGNKKWRIFNLATNKPVTDYVFDNYGGFGESRHGYFVVAKNRQFGVVDSLGNTILPFEYIAMNHADIGGTKPFFIFGKGVDRYNLDYGLADTNGNILLPAIYDGIREYIPSKDLFVAIKGQKFGIVNSKNETIISFDYKYIYFTRDDLNLLFCSNDADKAGMIDLTSKVIIPFQYDEMTTAKSKKILAKKNNLYGVIDQQNNILIRFEYKYLGSSGASAYMGMRSDKWGVIDKNGNELIPFIYDKFLDLYRDYDVFITEKNELQGLFEAPGRLIIEPKFIRIWSVPDTDLFEVTTPKGQKYYIDSDGKEYIL